MLLQKTLFSHLFSSLQLEYRWIVALRFRMYPYTPSFLFSTVTSVTSISVSLQVFVNQCNGSVRWVAIPQISITLLSHCCHTIITLLSHHLTLLSHYFTLLSPCCHLAVTLLSHYSHIAVTEAVSSQKINFPPKQLAHFIWKEPHFLQNVPCFPKNVPCIPQKVPCFLEKVAHHQRGFSLYCAALWQMWQQKT